MRNLTKQHGSAIIVALFVVALVAAASVVMLERLRTDIHRTELILNANTALLYAHGSTAWAIDTLNTNWKQHQPNQIIDKTPIKSPISKQNGALIESMIYDAQGRFNINNLSNAQYQTNFTRLIQLVSPETNATLAQQITLAIIDWISPGTKDPALEEYYLKQTPSYRPPHRLMVSISELRTVKGVTADLYTKLEPYVIALPQPTPININNASIPVLMCLSMTLTAEAAKAIIATSQKNPFQTPQDFLNYDIVKNNPIDATKITTTSDYFLAETNVKVSHQKMLLYTLLQRSTKDAQSNVLILWQSIGTL